MISNQKVGKEDDYQFLQAFLLPDLGPQSSKKDNQINVKESEIDRVN